ncbi:hypothetical protein A5644_26340 [Mycobacterium intracellulare subsp. yongonense]|nr:hypothetical protein A5644_26340 [Mycobacterium intracellulare subsp. yongonense]
MIVNGLDCGFGPWLIRIRFRREGIADSGHGRSDFARDLLIKSDHLRRALTNIIGIGLRLGLPNGALRDRTGSRTIGNRHVLAHIETRPKGVLDDISNSRACRGQVRGPASGGFCRDLQLVDNSAGFLHVGVRRGAQRISGATLPING